MRKRIKTTTCQLTYSTNPKNNKGLLKRRRQEQTANNRKQGLFIDQSVL
jgi:hypothetical protein